MRLDHKIPPPIIAAACAGLMYALAAIPLITLPHSAVFTAALALLGTAVEAAGSWAFYRARTTANPLAPEQASRIVQNGVYRFSRNPMYLGMVCYLAAWAAHLAQPLTWLGIAVFVLYITRFQIMPEERALLQKFGEEYADYCHRVRRWL